MYFLIELEQAKDDIVSLDDAWKDWEDDNQPKHQCLFCNDKRAKITPDLLDHLKLNHRFDMAEVMRDFTFYDRMKAVNYLRSKVKY